MHLGHRVRNLREMRGYGLNEFARLAEVSPGYLSQLETGKRANPSVEVLSRLAAALNVTVEYLIAPGDLYDPPPLLGDQDMMLRERKYAGLSESDREDIDELLNVKWKRSLTARHDWIRRLSDERGESVADLIALYGLSAVLEAGEIPSELALAELSDDALNAFADLVVLRLSGRASD